MVRMYILCVCKGGGGVFAWLIHKCACICMQTSIKQPCKVYIAAYHYVCILAFKHKNHIIIKLWFPDLPTPNCIMHTPVSQSKGI